MRSIPNKFSQYADQILGLEPHSLNNPATIPNLMMESCQVRNREVTMCYAPFDHVNQDARIVIVGMTPGRQQAANALGAAQTSLMEGMPLDKAAEDAKVFASFSGSMRGNLVRMLDLVGVAELLGLETTATLWDRDSSLVHFTSALRYPVFVDGDNWSGNPDMVKTPELRRWLQDYTGAELAALPDTILVPLGPKVTSALDHLASLGQIDKNRIMAGLPHPSGANNERIAYFLGEKPADLCSTKTNTVALDTAREALRARVSQLK